jgi:hypothetical protein
MFIVYVVLRYKIQCKNIIFIYINQEQIPCCVDSRLRQLHDSKLRQLSTVISSYAGWLNMLSRWYVKLLSRLVKQMVKQIKRIISSVQLYGLI